MDKTKKDRIKEICSEIIRLKAKRKELNAEIQALREDVEVQGIPKWAFDAALGYYQKDPDKRIDFDQGYATVREILGLPVQYEMDFTRSDEEPEPLEEFPENLDKKVAL